jgi:hypothetical protein
MVAISPCSVSLIVDGLLWPLAIVCFRSGFPLGKWLHNKFEFERPTPVYNYYCVIVNRWSGLNSKCVSSVVHGIVSEGATAREEDRDAQRPLEERGIRLQRCSLL